jgi:DNA-binding MarR family transcriptional regulator
MSVQTVSGSKRGAGGRPTYRTRRQAAALGVLQTADVLRRHFGRILEPADLTLQQYNVLRILRGALPEPLPTMEIGERMIERTPGITRLLDRLDGKGLVRRERCAEDRRQVLVSITDAGLALLKELDRPVARADQTALSMLADGEVDRLRRLLDRVREGL